MPKLRIGTIPHTRLSIARKVRDRLKEQLGTNGYAVVSIRNGGFSVCVRIYEGKDFVKEDIPREIDGVSVKAVRVAKIYPGKT